MDANFNTVYTMKILLLYFTFFLALIGGSFSALSQKVSSPLVPEEPPKQIELGAVFGLGQNNLKGLYKADCDFCEFESGNGFGYSIGAVFAVDIRTFLQAGALLTYDSKSLASSFKSIESVGFFNPPNNYEKLDIPFRYNADISIGAFDFQPFIQATPFDFLFARLGLGVYFIASSNISNEKNLLKFKDTLKTGEIVDLSFEDGKKKTTLEDRKIPGLNSAQFYLEPAVGFNFRLSERFNLSPVFQYSIPLTQLSDEQEDFKINSWRISLELRHIVKPREPIDIE